MATGTGTTHAPKVDPIVQYIIVRTDLKWSSGAMIAQACHASVASIARTISDPRTLGYLSDLENMHKVILKTDKGDELLELDKKLTDSNIEHHLWIEKPEMVATCLAVAPQSKSLVQAFFKHLKLLT